MAPTREQSIPGPRRRWLQVFGVALASWLLIGLIDCTWYYIMSAGKGKAPHWGEVLLVNIPYWLIVALLTPPVVWVARRTRFERGRRLRTVGIHFGCMIPFTVLHIVAYQAVMFARSVEPVPASKFLGMIPRFVATTFDKEILLYLVIVGTVFVTDYYQRYRERERTAAALELERAQLHASLSEARLEALHMQLQPHFLFNALHAISTLILKGDTRAANRTLSHLSHFLRMTLDGSNTPVVPLAVELEFLEAYLRIQKERFGDRLSVVTEIDERALTAGVPNLILQPLVENSIRHGIDSDAGLGTITVRARTDGTTLSLQVEDDGAGLPAGQATCEGVGLANVRARLEQLYPGAHAFALEALPGRGARATISIPFSSARDRTSARHDEETPPADEDHGYDSHTDRG
jgi:two-component system, LytTR family, sensor kinase